MSEKEIYEICLKTKNVRSLKINLGLTNDTLVYITNTDDGLYILTGFGLVYGYELETKKVRKMGQVFGLENPKAVCLGLGGKDLYFSNGKLVWVVDLQRKELKGLVWYGLGDISSIYVDEENVMFGTEQGNLIIFKNSHK